MVRDVGCAGYERPQYRALNAQARSTLSKAQCLNVSKGWIPALGNRGSTVRYSIPQPTFKYVATIETTTDETCQFRTPGVDQGNCCG